MNMLHYRRGYRLGCFGVAGYLLCTALSIEVPNACAQLIEPRVERIDLKPDRLDPAESGYELSYNRVVAEGVTGQISEILYDHQSAIYWDNIEASNVADEWREYEAAQIVRLKEKMSDLLPWLKETLPPPDFEGVHRAMLELADAIAISSEYKRLDVPLRSAYSAWKHLKWKVDERDPQPIEYEETSNSPTIKIRPLFLPIVYDVTTGKWSLSLALSTPLGSITISPAAEPKPISQAKGLLLVKIKIGRHARYIMMPPRTRVTFKKGDLTTDGFGWDGEMETIQFQPVHSPDGVQDSDVDMQIDQRRPVRRALPLNASPTPRR